MLKRRSNQDSVALSELVAEGHTDTPGALVDLLSERGDAVVVDALGRLAAPAAVAMFNNDSGDSSRTFANTNNSSTDTLGRRPASRLAITERLSWGALPPPRTSPRALSR